MYTGYSLVLQNTVDEKYTWVSEDVPSAELTVDATYKNFVSLPHPKLTTDNPCCC